MLSLPSSPSLMSLMVSVDVKHHVYLFTSTLPPSAPFSPSLISLTVSVDVKHHVYLLSPEDPFDVHTHARERNSLLMYRVKKMPRHCSVCYWAIQAGLLTPLTFARHRLSPLAAFTSGAYFLHNGRQWQWICEFYTANVKGIFWGP